LRSSSARVQPPPRHRRNAVEQGFEGLRVLDGDVAPGGGDAQRHAGLLRGAEGALEPRPAVARAATDSLAEVEGHALRRATELVGQAAVVFGNAPHEGPHIVDGSQCQLEHAKTVSSG
jgi:hypothetical protein